MLSSRSGYWYTICTVCYLKINRLKRAHRHGGTCCVSHFPIVHVSSPSALRPSEGLTGNNVALRAEAVELCAAVRAQAADNTALRAEGQASDTTSQEHTTPSTVMTAPDAAVPAAPPSPGFAFDFILPSAESGLPMRDSRVPLVIK